MCIGVMDIISYTKSEVESDKKLANYLGIPLISVC